MRASRRIWVSFAVALLAGGMSARGVERPNVILILADDMGLGDVARFNGGINRTPAIDRMIERGLWFNHAYTASPVCAPARAALLTGRAPHRTGVVSLNMMKEPQWTRLHPDETTLAAVFAAQGYRTGLIGKWHTGIGDGDGPIRRGFQEFEGFHGSGGDMSFFNYAIQTDDRMDNTELAGAYLTDDLSERAVAFVRRHADRPFFLHLAHYAPHRPLEAPEDVIRPYEAAGLDRETATVYAMIEIMDRGIGELMDELERMEIARRTLVLFSSDNGPDPLVPRRFNFGLKGTKYEIHEGGIRVPMVFTWPGRIAPGERDEPVAFTDIFPTLLEICGIDFSSGRKLDGVSFAPLLTGGGGFEPPVRFWQWNRAAPNYTHNAAMRDGPWKLVRPFVTWAHLRGDSTEPPVLYHIGMDPMETTDLSTLHPERRGRMIEALDAWCGEVERDRCR